MPVSTTPRPSPVAYLWPLIALAAIGVFWLLFVVIAKALVPVSDTATLPCPTLLTSRVPTCESEGKRREGPQPNAMATSSDDEIRSRYTHFRLKTQSAAALPNCLTMKTSSLNMDAGLPMRASKPHNQAALRNEMIFLRRTSLSVATLSTLRVVAP